MFGVDGGVQVAEISCIDFFKFFFRPAPHSQQFILPQPPPIPDLSAKAYLLDLDSFPKRPAFVYCSIIFVFTYVSRWPQPCLHLARRLGKTILINPHQSHDLLEALQLPYHRLRLEDVSKDSLRLWDEPPAFSNCLYLKIYYNTL